MELAAQIIGLVAAAFNIYAFQMKGNKYLYLRRAIGGTLFAISFFMKETSSFQYCNAYYTVPGQK